MATPVDLAATFRSHDALSLLEHALQRLFPHTRAALRAAATPQKETPTVAAAGVSEVPTSLDRSEAMHTVPQSHPAPRQPAALAELGTAQHTALLRWHNRRPLSEVYDALQAHPTFPRIPCNPDARAFAPGRGTPRPAA